MITDGRPKSFVLIAVDEAVAFHVFDVAGDLEFLRARIVGLVADFAEPRRERVRPSLSELEIAVVATKVCELSHCN